MAKELLMPKLGLTMEEGTIVEWYIGEGDSFKSGDLIYAVETEKLTNDVEANEDGEILEILVNEGETVEVKTPVARLVGYEEESSAEAEVEAEEEEKEVKKEKKTAEKAVKKESSSRKVMAAPKTRKFASDKDVDLAEVADFVGKNNVGVSDIEKYLAKGEAAEESAPTEKKGSSSMRRVIGERLTESWRAPHIYLRKEINVESIIELKERLKARDSRVSFNDIIAFITAKAISDFKKINSLEKDSGEFKIAEDVNLGLAVAVDDGLLVPVIDKAETLSLEELAAKSKDLISRTKENRLNPDEMQGGTFTITNLGMFGIDEFTAILNPPQAAILAVGTIKEKLYLNADDEVKVKKIINFTLGVDHRAVDGAAGAQFMQVFADYIENPYLCF